MQKRDVAVLLLYNDKGEILLQQRARDAKRYPLAWAIFGGGIEEGESPEMALKRELVEELGYSSNDAVLIHKQPFTNNLGESGTKYIFVEKYRNAPLSQHDGEGLGWFLPEDVGSLQTIPHDEKAFAAAAEYIKTHL